MSLLFTFENDQNNKQTIYFEAHLRVMKYSVFLEKMRI